MVHSEKTIQSPYLVLGLRFHPNAGEGGGLNLGAHVGHSNMSSLELGSGRCLGGDGV